VHTGFVEFVLCYSRSCNETLTPCMRLHSASPLLSSALPPYSPLRFPCASPYSLLPFPPIHTMTWFEYVVR